MTAWSIPGGTWLLTLLSREQEDQTVQRYSLPLALSGVTLARVRQRARVGILYSLRT
jgi:hypothetical protein